MTSFLTLSMAWVIWRLMDLDVSFWFIFSYLFVTNISYWTFFFTITYLDLSFAYNIAYADVIQCFFKEINKKNIAYR